MAHCSLRLVSRLPISFCTSRSLLRRYSAMMPFIQCRLAVSSRGGNDSKQSIKLLSIPQQKKHLAKHWWNSSHSAYDWIRRARGRRAQSRGASSSGVARRTATTEARASRLWTATGSEAGSCIRVPSGSVAATSILLPRFRCGWTCCCKHSSVDPYWHNILIKTNALIIEKLTNTRTQTLCLLINFLLKLLYSAILL